MKTYVVDSYKAFKDFKTNVGSNNQHIITSLIGIEKIDMLDIGKERPMTWNPKNISDAKDRANLFVRKAGLAWSIDCLDILLTDFINSFFDENNVFKKVGENEIEIVDTKDSNLVNSKEYISFNSILRSVYYKYQIATKLLESEISLNEWRKNQDYRIGKDGGSPYFPELELVKSIIDLGIQWRNILVHSGASNTTLMNTFRILQKYSKLLNSIEYGTLDVDTMIKRFKSGDVLSFKELAVVNRTIIDFGYILNAYWINKSNKEIYLRKALSRIDDKEWKKRIKNYGYNRKKKAVIMILNTQGIYLKEVEAGEVSIEEMVIEDFIKTLNE